MSFDPFKLARKNIRELIPYSSARDEFTGRGSIYLDANENPFNAPYNRYPDPRQKLLKSKAGEFFSVSPEKIFLGNGSDEAIDLLFRVFCEPGEDNAVSMSPSYGMYSVCAGINNVEMRKVLLNEDYSLNVKSILEASDEHTRLIFLCSPNNPTGNMLEISDILDLAKKTDALLAVDEAYIDFSGTNGVLPHLDEFPNLVVLRTFSKAWGLAGIRLGMAFASEEIVGLLSKVKYPYNLNVLTQDYALKMISETKQREEWVREIVTEREIMVEKLDRMPGVDKIHPSKANFLLVKVKKPKELYNYLKDKGIIVRDRSQVELCEGAVRITIGTKIENKILLREMYRFYSGGKNT